MDSFNKTEAAIFSTQAMLPQINCTITFSKFNYIVKDPNQTGTQSVIGVSLKEIFNKFVFILMT